MKETFLGKTQKNGSAGRICGATKCVCVGGAETSNEVANPKLF